MRGTTVASGVVGVRRADRATPATLDDPFHLGSGTKAMTATLVAMAVDEGRLGWTSTLGELLPELKSMDPAFAPVTIEMLLAHRSGLGSEATFDGGALFAALRGPGVDPVGGRRRVAEAMLSAPPASTPGAFAYGNANYVIVAHVLEKLSGRSWESLIRTRLFEPLGMASCGFGALGDLRGDLEGRDPAFPYAHRVVDGANRPIVLDNPATLGPAGTVHCSLPDWAKFVALHVDAFDGRPRLVSTTGFAKLHAAVPGQDYTCGGWIRTERGWAGGPVFTHDGSNTLNYASVWWAPKRRAILLAATNVGPPAGQDAAQRAISALVALLVAAGPD